MLFAAAAMPVAGRSWAQAEVEATLSRSTVPVGETATLVIVVRGGSGRVVDPAVRLPEGVAVLGSGRMENSSWVNGRSSREITFRYELSADRPGTYRIGPITVRAGSATYEVPGAEMSVVPGRPRVAGGGGRGPASLVVDLSPAEPYVGQPAILRVRLVQRAEFAEVPGYTPPASAGFWSEKSSQPESYMADEGGRRVLVTETRTRLYAIAPGTAELGEALVLLQISGSGPRNDPFGWLGAQRPRRDVEVRSEAFSVRVRPLPPGAPAGFDGAVGQLSADWGADRSSTPQDVPFVVRLDLRGVGNLPLIHTPAWSHPDAEIFAGGIEDSSGRAGSLDPGRRRFEWTVLARRPGRLWLEPPRISWFDPEAKAYRSAGLAPVEVEILPPTSGEGDAAGVLPQVFARHPVDPLARPPDSLLLGWAGVLLAVAARALRSGAFRPARPATDEPAWRQGLRHARGASFWGAAERACEELSARRVDVADLRSQVAAARYGGAAVSEDAARQTLLGRLEASDPRSGRPVWLRVAAVGGLVAGLGLIAAGWPYPGEGRATQDMFAADRAAGAGEVPRAVRSWESLWRRGSRHPALAARLAWNAMRNEDPGRAAAWVLLGERREARDPAITWVAGQVREAGGLSGYDRSRLPVRPLEWVALAWLAALPAVWFRRRGAIAALAAAALLAAADPLQRLWNRREERAVVTSNIPLEGAGVELVPGQVVRIEERSGARIRVRAGKDARGWVPAATLVSERVQP
jgi:hypothetical protein